MVITPGEGGREGGREGGKGEGEEAPGNGVVENSGAHGHHT